MESNPACAADDAVNLLTVGDGPWPLSSITYDPILDDPADTRKALSDLMGDLAQATSVFTIRLRHRTSDSCHEREAPQCLTLSSQQLLESLNSNNTYAFQLFAVSRYLHRPDRSPPPDHRKLQISAAAFKSLATSFGLPARFVAAIPRHYQVCGTGFRKTGSAAWDYWCLVPVRVTVPCYVQNDEHAKSTAGSNQMDPFHYIHLGGAKVDIRGSHVAICMQRLPNTGRSVVTIVSLLDGRWCNIVEQPLARVRETLHQTADGDCPHSPLFVLLIYISAILQWWNNVLWCFHKQLVIHEKSLQEVIANETSAFSTLSKEINKHLHTMAAHLHRYNSELNRLQYILDEIAKEQIYCPSGRGDGDEHARLLQLSSKSHVIRNFCDELERKVQNILTLLFNQIQATNDRTLQAILLAAQDDTFISRQLAIQSHELSRSMKKDSIAMKTIAIMTMAFLPGTSFAALLSMPFFDNDDMSDPTKVWIWILLSVPSTAASFFVFWRITKRESKAYADSSLQIESAIPLRNVPASSS